MNNQVERGAQGFPVCVEIRILETQEILIPLRKVFNSKRKGPVQHILPIKKERKKVNIFPFLSWQREQKEGLKLSAIS